ncbi:MAG: HesA/MoeB/ThiF family protein [Ferruginibacter sp.]
MDTNNLYERYQRQIILKEFGEAGQLKLQAAKVLVIGAGGLGCPALQYLAAAGVGTIGIIDDDIVSLSNLHRQVLYSTGDVGVSKALEAKAVLEKLNDGITVIAYNERLTTANALSIFSAFDIIVDGTDNFATRYLVNDACVLLGKPLVYGAVSQFEGQVAVFNSINKTGPPTANYRDLFPQPPKDGEVLSCAEAGVLGVLPGIIGTMQANETIKLITGIGQPLINSLLTFNALNNQFYQLTIKAHVETRALIPLDKTAFLQMDYEWLCASTFNQPEITTLDFDTMCAEKNVTIIDVREATELPRPIEFNYVNTPLVEIINNNIPVIDTENIVVFCQTGKRSAQAAQLLFNTFGTSKKIYSLQGGIVNWIKNKQPLQK